MTIKQTDKNFEQNKEILVPIRYVIEDSLSNPK